MRKRCCLGPNVLKWVELEKSKKTSRDPNWTQERPQTANDTMGFYFVEGSQRYFNKSSGLG